MSSWAELEAHLSELDVNHKAPWLATKLGESLRDVSRLRGGRNVLLYGSAFLQKPEVPGDAVSVSFEDINGLMAALHRMEWERELTLILHTPGGVTNATEAIVNYLRSKFTSIEVFVPTYAMSAGTMISLACDRIWMARHSQLGPIDPQMRGPNGAPVSARSIVDQFESAKLEILANSAAAHAWAPILASMGPSLVRSAQDALDYSEEIVANWLSKWMLRDDSQAEDRGKAIAHFFNDAQTHKSHGRRIGRDEARSEGVVVSDIEDQQDLQEAVLTAYHLMTMILTSTPATKLMMTNHGQTWVKNLVMIGPPQIDPGPQHADT